MKRKIYVTLIAGALAVSMMGTTVMAASGEATGDTQFTYQAGTAGPTDPVVPGEEETDENNWLVTYPRTITLTDSNIGEAPTDFQTNGAPLQFSVKQRQAGADGDTTITEDNIPNGIDVIAVDAKSITTPANSVWTSGTDITLEALSGSTGEATMNLGSFANAAVQKNGTVGNLTHLVSEDSGSALITDDSTVVDGASYGATVNFRFAPGTV